MTQTYASDMPATGDETPDRSWALPASIAISTVGIVFSLGAWIWADNQLIDYGELSLRDVGSQSGLAYFPIYLTAMLAAGAVSLGLAVAGARFGRQRPWLAVVAGAMAMFLIAVPVVFVTEHAVSHWHRGQSAETVGD